MTLTQTMSHHTTLRCALAGLIPPLALTLVFIATMVLGAVFQHVDQGTGSTIGVLLVLTALAAGGALWALALAAVTGVKRAGRLAVASAISQAGMTALAIIALGRLEVELVERGRSALPMHVLYTALFVPATFLCAAVVGGALGFALGDMRLAGRLAWRGGLAAALAYLALNVAQDVLGRRVGGPNAAATATMITVTLACYAGAAVAMSAVIGLELITWHEWQWRHTAHAE